MMISIFGLLFVFALCRADTLYYCKKVYMTANYTYPESIMTKWFKQKLDHTDQDNPTFWNQRYYERRIYWNNEKEGPIFLLLTGEFEASRYLLQNGFWNQLAQQFGALRFVLEHRYYGLSQPTNDTSTENLKYLTVNNVLSDVSNFVRSIRQTFNLTNNNKWIIFGGGYGGNIAAWSQIKLRRIVYGAVVSSAPLQATVDFSDYQIFVREVIDSYYKNCSSPILQAVESIKKKFQSPEGTKELATKFQVCKGDIDNKNPKNMALFFHNIFRWIHNTVEFDYGQQYLEDVGYLCKTMENPSVPDPVDRLAKLYGHYNYVRNLFGNGEKCLEADYKAYIKNYKEADWSDPNVQNGKRQWLYQRCNELGYFQTSTAKESYLHNILPLKYFIGRCMDVFGTSFNEEHVKKGVAGINKNHKGLNLNPQSAIFVKNDYDPWMTLGLQKAPKTSSYLLSVEDSAHCLDMKQTENAYDSGSLISTRKKIINILKNKWNLKYYGK